MSDQEYVKARAEAKTTYGLTKQGGMSRTAAEFNFVQGADWSKSYFEKIVAEKDAKIAAQYLLLDNEAHARLTQREKIASRDAMIEKLKGYLDICEDKKNSPTLEKFCRKVIAEIVEWEKTK